MKRRLDVPPGEKACEVKISLDRMLVYGVKLYVLQLIIPLDILTSG
jgi:hypothetical protein